jgi:hypothetical protein
LGVQLLPDHGCATALVDGDLMIVIADPRRHRVARYGIAVGVEASRGDPVVVVYERGLSLGVDGREEFRNGCDGAISPNGEDLRRVRLSEDANYRCRADSSTCVLVEKY